MKNANLAQLPPDYGVMDYISTHQDDFRNPYPCVMKPVSTKTNNLNLKPVGTKKNCRFC